MRFLHQSMFVSLSLLLACAGKSGESNNPDAGEYDDYYSENPDDPAAGGSANGTNDGEPKVAKTSDSTSTVGVSPSMVAKKIAAKKPAVNGTKKKKKKNKKKKKKGNAFKVAFDGALPSAAPRGALVEVFGSGLDQKNLMIAIGGAEQEIVEQSEDRAVFRVTKGVSGGKGAIQLGKKPAEGKKFKAVDSSSYDFEVLGKVGFGTRELPEQGLIGNVYAIDGEVTELPQFSGDPIATIAVDNLDRTADNLKVKIGGRTEWYGIHFRGSLNIVEAGSYEFCLNADDGAQMYLDQNVIIDNDGVHEAKEVCETFSIDPGEFGFDLLWFQAAQGPMALQLTWAKDGGAKEPIPATAFFPPADAADLARE